MVKEFQAWQYKQYGLHALFEGNVKIALLYFNKALKLDPTLVEVIYNRGNLYSILKMSDKAISDYDLAIKLDPQHYKAYICRGITYLEQKQNAEALRKYL